MPGPTLRTLVPKKEVDITIPILQMDNTGMRDYGHGHNYKSARKILSSTSSPAIYLVNTYPYKLFLTCIFGSTDHALLWQSLWPVPTYILNPNILLHLFAYMSAFLLTT